MTGTPLDARGHLESLVGRLVGAPNVMTITVVEVQQSVAVVCGDTDQNEVILLAWVQWGLDHLLSTGEVLVPPDAFGTSTGPLVALLAAVPGAHATADGTVVLESRPGWNIRAGEVVDRPGLHARFGGNARTRLAPSASTPNVFVFVDADHEATGFWRGGVLHVPGERVPDKRQSNVNRAVAGHRDSDRTLRVFWRSGEVLIYAGAFQTDLREPFYFTEAEDREGAREERIVFRLIPAGAVVENIETVAPAAVESEEEAAEPEALLSAEEPVAGAPPGWLRAPAAAWVANSVRTVGARGPWPAIVLASCAAIALTTWAWTSAPVRPAVTTWFLLVCPGMALVRLLPDRGLMLRLVLAVATSLVLETLVATFMLEAKAWAPSATLGILLLITVAATVLDLRARPRRPSIAWPDHALAGWTRR
jgi:hypothetical protein